MDPLDADHGQPRRSAVLAHQASEPGGQEHGQSEGELTLLPFFLAIDT